MIYSIDYSEEKDAKFTALGYTTVCIKITSLVLNAICLVGLLRTKKFLKCAKYEFILQYYTFKFIQVLAMIKSLLMIETIGLVKSSHLMCRVEFFLNDFADSTCNFCLFSIWLIFMSERDMTDFKFLYNNSIFTTAQESILHKPLKIFKKRYLFLVVIYLINFFVSLYTANKLDLSTYGGCGAKEYISIYTFSFHVIPFSFWILSFSILLWNFFGGYRDPMLSNLTRTDLKFIKYFKLSCLFEGTEVFINYASVMSMFSLGYYENFNLVSKFIGSLCCLAVLSLFLYYEDLFGASLGEKICKFINRNRSSKSSVLSVNINNSSLESNNDDISHSNNSFNYTVLVNDL